MSACHCVAVKLVRFEGSEVGEIKVFSKSERGIVEVVVSEKANLEHVARKTTFVFNLVNVEIGFRYHLIGCSRAALMPDDPHSFVSCSLLIKWIVEKIFSPRSTVV